MNCLRNPISELVMILITTNWFCWSYNRTLVKKTIQNERLLNGDHRRFISPERKFLNLIW